MTYGQRYAAVTALLIIGIIIGVLAGHGLWTTSAHVTPAHTDVHCQLIIHNGQAYAGNCVTEGN
jgi:hypothetical protein